MVIKIVFIAKCNEKKLFETHYSSEKNCLQVPKMVTPPPPPIKNNGSSLKSRQVCRVGPDPAIITLQIPNYTVCLNIFDNHLAHAFYATFDLNLFIGH